MTEYAENDIAFMLKALARAQKAFKIEEVPIGAVIVKDGVVISSGYNLKEKKLSATRHAEMIAIERACKKLGNWRLTGTTLYVNVEPCVMCAGAILQSRIKRVVYGCADKKFGACGSLYDMSNDSRMNHSFEVTAGILRDESIELMQSFFQLLRRK